MDNVVYLDYKAKEFENLKNGKKTMIIRGAMGRKLPYGRVSKSDILYKPLKFLAQSKIVSWFTKRIFFILPRYI